jgi:N-dimethylarginine dimethylaminohydrolase
MNERINRQKTVVKKFLHQCNEYSHKKINEYKNTYKASDNTKKSEEKIKQWKNYIQFNEHAIHELNTDRLNHWFD